MEGEGGFSYFFGEHTTGAYFGNHGHTHNVCQFIGFRNFLTSAFGHHLKAFSNSNWPNSSGIERYICLVFGSFDFLKIKWRTKKLLAQSKLTCLTLFSWYLNRLNFNFDPWVVILKVIQYSSQWPWNYPNQTVRSKVNPQLPWKVNPRSKLVKVVKKLQQPWIWYRNMKNVILLEFWSILTFS